MFKSICIIGCGLIGSSILRNVKKKKLSKKVTVFDKSTSVRRYLKRKRLCNNVSTNLKKSVLGADLVIIASPLSSYNGILKAIKHSLKVGAILTDTGSVKREINEVANKLKIDNVSWIASHPIAGTEESGPQAGDINLFKGRWCVLSPSKNSKKNDLIKLEKFWMKLGSKVKIMSFLEHDYILSLTSHLPHAIAYNLVITAIQNDKKSKKEIVKYSAGGLRDFTRIASSNPIMWKDIFLDNSDNMVKILSLFIKNLNRFKNAIRRGDSKKLLSIFKLTKTVREDIIRAGQDTDKPDFGRKKS